MIPPTFLAVMSTKVVASVELNDEIALRALERLVSIEGRSERFDGQLPRGLLGIFRVLHLDDLLNSGVRFGKCDGFDGAFSGREVDVERFVVVDDFGHVSRTEREGIASCLLTVDFRNFKDLLLLLLFR